MNPSWHPELLTALVGGSDSGNEPELVGNFTASKLRNVSIRGGRAKSRPRTKKVLTLPSGKIQGALVFQGRNQLLASIDGKVYEIEPDTWEIEEKTDAASRGNPNRPRHWYCETQGSVVIQDFQNSPLIYDGSEFRKAEEDEVPVGGVMHYSNGRLAVAVGTGNQVRIGDIRKPEHQSELKFTETYFLTGGGDFSFASKVTAITSVPVIDTSTGQGSLIVGCRGRVYSLKTQITSRDLWADVEFQTELFPNVGISGQTAVTQMNQDLMFRSLDGLRSLRAAVGDFSSPGQTPLSREVSHRLDHDSDFLLEYGTVVNFDNRIFATHSPILYGNRAINLGLVVYNLDSLSRAGTKSAPVYDGEWDFAEVAEMVVGEIDGHRRCFVLGRDSDGNNGLWEIYREAEEPEGITESPTQEIITRAFVGEGINAYKVLRRCDVWLSKIHENTNLKIYYRAGQYPYWVLWDEFDINVTRPTSGTSHPIYRNPISTRTVPEEFDPRVQQEISTGFTFQIRLVWTGNARIDAVQLWSDRINQPSVSDNVEHSGEYTYGEVPEGHENPTFWYSYSRDPNP